MKKLSIHAFILFGLLFLPIFVQAQVRSATVYGTVHTGELERAILDSVNEQRRNAGVPELQMDYTLTRAARQRAIEIGTYYDSRHLRTDLSRAASVMDDFGIGYYAFGENIAAGYSNVDTVMNAWITSTPHYNNIVNTRYNAIGIGVYQSTDGRWFWVQNYSDSLNSVYSPDSTNAIRGNYSVRYEDSIHSEYYAESLSDQALEVGEVYEIPFHVTTYNEVTNSSIPLYLLDWGSSNPSVAEILINNQTVSVLAKSAGEANIETTFGGVTYQFKVTVTDPNTPVVNQPQVSITTNINTSPTLLDIDPTEDISTLNISVEETSLNSITLYYDDGSIVNRSAFNIYFCENKNCTTPIQPIRYQSGNEKIAKYVDGDFIFQNSGKTTITAIFENGLQVQVPFEVSSYQFEQTQYNMFTSTTKTANIVSDKELENTFSSENEEIVSISENGVLTANKAGSTMIRALRADGLITYAKINVYDEDELSINVDRENVELTEDESVHLTITSNKENTTFSYQIEDETITQFKDGTLSAIKPGKTTLTISATYKVADGLVLKATRRIPITVLKKEILVTDLLIDKTEYELLIGDELNLTVKVIPDNADCKDLSWKSDNSSVASVDSNGKVSALAAGNAVITVAAVNGVKKEIKIVVKEPDGLYVDTKRVELNVGDVHQINAYGSDKTLTWQSEDESIATVDQDGLIKAIGKGSTIVHVTDGENDVEITVIVTLVIPITNIIVEETDIELVEGDTTTIVAKIIPEDTTDSLVLGWMSSNEDVLSVDQNGNITALSPGKSDITITSVNGVRSIVHVNVSRKPMPITNLVVDVDTIRLLEGEHSQISVTIQPNNTTDETDLKFESNNPKVAEVDQNGIVHALADGQAEITITAKNGVSTTVNIIVTKKVPITDLQINRNSLTLNVGEQATIKATVLPGNTTDDKSLIWSSSNYAIATVQDGIITAKASGNVTIYVKTTTGIQKEIHVFVKQPIVPVKNEFDVIFDTNTVTLQNENGKAILVLKDIIKTSQVKISENERVIAFYDIQFIEGDNNTFKDPTYHIGLPIPLDIQKYESIYIALVVDGQIKETYLPYIEDTWAYYTNDHFSEYAVIGVLKKEEKSSNTSKSSTTKTDTSSNPDTGNPIIIYIIIWIIAFLLLSRLTILLFENKKNDI